MSFTETLQQLRRVGRETGWEIAGTSGASVSVGTPELKIAATAGYLRMPLKNTAAGSATMFQGGGAGVSVGIDISIPFVNASGGPDQMPSFGSRILRGPSCPLTVNQQSFSGRVLMITGSVMGTAVSNDLTLVFFLAELPAIVQMVANATPFAMSTILPATKGIGICYGLNIATTLGGFGANAAMYVIVPTGPAS